jgi:2-desacetyl-2-hydroxyethyl bacteriochlorophyllide A dehydrogenase
MMQRQCLWFDAPYRVCVRDEPIPQLAPTQVLAQTLVSAISAGTELLFYRDQVPPQMTGDATINALKGTAGYPLRYGYACVGRVIELGAQVGDEWRDRLVFSFQPHASHFVASVDELIPIPETISPEQAAFLANMETAINFLMDGSPIIGERVVVLGQGVVGLITTALLAQMPLARLMTFDRFPLRRQLSRAFGASESFDPEIADDVQRAQSQLSSNGADLTYELTGAPDALNLAIDLTGFSGRIIIGSWYGQKRAPIDLGGSFHRSRIRMISSQVSTIAPEFVGRWSKARRMETVHSMLARLPLSNLVTHRFPISDAAQAYALIDQHPEQALQILFTY